MNKDLVIGGIGDYQYHQIENWVNSLNKSGFDGDKILLSYNSNDELITRLTSEGIEVIPVSNDAFGNNVPSFITHSGMVNRENAHMLVHNVRFFHIWQLLKQFETEGRKYNNVITTDVRDVIFQTNPTDWLETNMRNKIIAPSESVKYKDENWNTDNFRKSFGDMMFHYLCNLDEILVCNVGTFAGKAEEVMNLSLAIYLYAVGHWHSDQPAFNVLVNTIVKDKTQFVGPDDYWACQVGTLVERKDILGDKLLDEIPVMKDGLVYNSKGDLFCLVHQYERIPGWFDIISEQYR